MGGTVVHGCSLGESEADATVLGYYLSIHENFTSIRDASALVPVLLPLFIDQVIDGLGCGIIKSMADNFLGIWAYRIAPVVARFSTIKAYILNTLLLVVPNGGAGSSLLSQLLQIGLLLHLELMLHLGLKCCLLQSVVDGRLVSLLVHKNLVHIFNCLEGLHCINFLISYTPSKLIDIAIQCQLIDLGLEVEIRAFSESSQSMGGQVWNLVGVHVVHLNLSDQRHSFNVVACDIFSWQFLD